MERSCCYSGATSKLFLHEARTDLALLPALFSFGAKVQASVRLT
jgi:hypothetical protein